MMSNSTEMYSDKHWVKFKVSSSKKQNHFAKMYRLPKSFLAPGVTLFPKLIVDPKSVIVPNKFYVVPRSCFVPKIFVPKSYYNFPKRFILLPKVTILFPEVVLFTNITLSPKVTIFSPKFLLAPGVILFPKMTLFPKVIVLFPKDNTFLPNMFLLQELSCTYKSYVVPKHLLIPTMILSLQFFISFPQVFLKHILIFQSVTLIVDITHY